MASRLLQSRPYLGLLQQRTVQFRDASGMTETLLRDQIEFPHCGLERKGRLRIQIRLVIGPGGFASGPRFAGFLVADDANHAGKRFNSCIEASCLGGKAILFALPRSDFEGKVRFDRCPTLKLVLRRYRCRAEHIPVARPRTQLVQAVIEFVRALPAYAIGGTRSRGVVDLTSGRDGRGQDTGRRFVESPVTFLDFRFGQRQRLDRLVDFQLRLQRGRLRRPIAAPSDRKSVR